MVLRSEEEIRAKLKEVAEKESDTVLMSMTDGIVVSALLWVLKEEDKIGDYMK